MEMVKCHKQESSYIDIFSPFFFRIRATITRLTRVVTPLLKCASPTCLRGCLIPADCKEAGIRKLGAGCWSPNLNNEVQFVIHSGGVQVPGHTCEFSLPALRLHGFPPRQEIY